MENSLTGRLKEKQKLTSRLESKTASSNLVSLQPWMSFEFTVEVFFRVVEFFPIVFHIEKKKKLIVMSPKRCLLY